MLSPEIQSLLSEPLDPRRVTTGEAGPLRGIKYLEGHDVIETANRIFGYGGWAFMLLSAPTCVEKGSQGDRQTAYEVWMAQGQLTIENAGVFTDVGTCVRNGTGASGLEMAIKGAATDALKRCLRNYGDQFGLVLYEKGLTLGDLARDHNASHQDVPLPPMDAPPAAKVAKGVPEWWPAYRKAKQEAHVTDAEIEMVIGEGPTVAVVTQWLEAEEGRHWSNLIAEAQRMQKSLFEVRS